MKLMNLVAAAAIVALGCGSPGDRVVDPTPVQPTGAPTSAPADEAFRKTPPAPGPEVRFTPPKIQEARLKNGLRVLLVERHELPIVAVQIAIDRGASEAGPSIGGFTGAMMLAGTKKRSTVEISDAFDRIGAQYGAGVGFDMSWVWGQVVTSDTDALLDLLGDIVQNPTFRQDEIGRERTFRLTALQQEQDRPATLLSNAVASALYPQAHPYATSLLGTREGITKIDQQKLRRFFAETFVPAQATVVVAGDTTLATITPLLERTLGTWKGARKDRKVIAAPPADPNAARVILLDRPGSTQSHVALALTGVPRRTPDFEAIVVMNAILGGQFSSRLNLSLREKHAYTYGVRSNFDMRHGAGPFTAGGAIFREKTDAAVREMLTEVERIRTTEVTEEELADAKSQIIRAIPARFETIAETVSAVTGLAIYDLPLDDYAARIERISKVTRADVKRVAEQSLVSSRMKVVIVGDAAVIKTGLEAVGLGKVEVIAPPPPKPEDKPKTADGAKPGDPKAPAPKDVLKAGGIRGALPTLKPASPTDTRPGKKP